MTLLGETFPLRNFNYDMAYIILYRNNVVANEYL